MPEQDLFLTGFHRFIIKYDSREEENPLFSSKFWGFEMFVEVPKGHQSESLGEKQFELRNAMKEIMTHYVVNKRDGLTAGGFIAWTNSNPGYIQFLRKSGIQELKLDNFSKLYYQDVALDQGFDYTSKRQNLFSKDYIVKRFKAERLVKKEGDKKFVTEDEDYSHVITIELGDIEFKIENPISETYVKFALQELADLFAERCTFKDISKRSIIMFANKSFSKRLGMKITDIGSIDVKKIQSGETMATFSHNYIKGEEIEI